MSDSFLAATEARSTASAYRQRLRLVKCSSCDVKWACDKGRCRGCADAARMLAAKAEAEEAAAVAAAAVKVATQVLWPPIATHQVDTNESRTVEGVTAKGTKWSYFECNQHDPEDNDDTFSFTLGELTIHRNQNRGRDCASDTRSVSYRGEQVYQSGDFQCRDPTRNKDEEASCRDTSTVALEAVAAAEGVTLRVLQTALPIKF